MKRLTSKNLMAGDWASYAGKHMRVSGRIIADLEFNELNYIEREGFEPIPITPEILEKNGFVKIDYSIGAYEKYEFDENGLPSKKIAVSRISSNKWFSSIYTACGQVGCAYTQSVHMLQHFLRLCEIEKDIEL